MKYGTIKQKRLPPEKTEERKAEVRAAFKNMVEKAAGYGAKVIVLAGDVFDSDRPLKKDKEFFYSVVKNNPDIDFLYLRGNHDNLESYSEDLDNLKTFTNEWSGYSYGNVEFYGLETAAENYSSMYSSLKLDPAKINIVILHGQKSDSVGKDKINIAKLKNKNIDYLALGHIHSVNFGRIDERGVYAYPGCLEGRGFDETGAKGFILVDTEDGKINAGFVENSVRKTDEFTVDISAGAEKGVATDILKRDLIAGYMSYGYYYVQNYGYTTAKAYQLVLDNLVNNAVIIQQSKKELAGDYKSKVYVDDVKVLTAGDVEALENGAEMLSLIASDNDIAAYTAKKVGETGYRSCGLRKERLRFDRP